MIEKSRDKGIKYELEKFIRSNRWQFLLGIFMLIVIYGRQLYVLNARIDTEELINDPHGVYNWLTIGRQGGILTRKVFEGGNFNPYYATIGSFLIYFLCMVIFCYLLNYIGKIKTTISVLIFVTFMIHPIWIEQMYFTMMVLEIAVALLFTITAVLMSYYGILKKNNIIKIVAIPPLIWAFGTYQAFVVLFIALTIFCFLLLYRNNSFFEDVNDDKTLNRKILYLVIQLIVIFAAAFIINTIITKLFFASGVEYLEGQILWGKVSLSQCISNILVHIKQVITCGSLFYTWGYSISLIAIIIGFFRINKLVENKFLKVMYILAVIGMQVCPFLITIYGANIPAKRAQFILPFVVAANFGLALVMIKKEMLQFIIGVICILSIISNSSLIMRLQYTDDIRFQEDMRFAGQIELKLQEKVGEINKPLAFVGVHDAALNNSCIRGELIGSSIFNFDSMAPPHYLNSSKRICNILKTMGIKFNNVTAEQMLEARLLALDMPNWPQDGSIKEEKEYIIVKLSDDIWATDDLDIVATEIGEIKEITNDDDFKWCIDEIRLESGKAYINGWGMKKGEDAENYKIKVCLKDEDSYKIYSFHTDKIARPDVEEAFNDNTADYVQSGFRTVIQASMIKQAKTSYRIILQYSNGDEKYYIDTQQTIEI